MVCMYVHGNYYLFFSITNVVAAPTRHFVVLSKVWFLILKHIVFEAYLLLGRMYVHKSMVHTIHTNT